MMICSTCHKPVPDSFNDYKEECKCKNWINEAVKNKWKLRVKGVIYDFTEEEYYLVKNK